MIPYLAAKLASPLAKYAIIGGLILAAIAGWFLWLHTHDNTVRAVAAANVATVTAAQQQRDAQAGAVAVGDAARQDATRAATLSAGQIEVSKDGTDLADPRLADALRKLLQP